MLIQNVCIFVSSSSRKTLVTNWQDVPRPDVDDVWSLGAFKKHDLRVIILVVLLEGPLKHWCQFGLIKTALLEKEIWVTVHTGRERFVEGVVADNIRITRKML